MFSIQIKVNNKESHLYDQWRGVTLGKFEVLEEALENVKQRSTDTNFNYRILDAKRNEVWNNTGKFQ